MAINVRGTTIYGPNNVTDSIILNLDAANIQSYPQIGTAWSDLSGFGNNATLIGGSSFSSANLGSIVFDGANNYVESNINNFFTSYSQQITMETWIYVPSSATWSNGSISPILTRGSFAGCHGLWRNTINNQIIAFFRQSGATFSVVQATGSITRDNWFQLVATWTSPTLSLYINGILSGSSSGSLETTTSNAPFTWGRGGIGASGLVGNFFTGNQSLTRIYTRAISGVEVLRNFNAQKSRYGL